MIMKFNENIPHYKLKAALINQELTMSKKIKFYHSWSYRQYSNYNFITKCRFYWYDADPKLLCQVFY